MIMHEPRGYRLLEPHRLDLDPIASPEQPAEFAAAYDASTHQILITGG